MLKNVLHVNIGREEYKNAVGDNLAQASQKLAVGIWNLYVTSCGVLRAKVLLVKGFA